MRASSKRLISILIAGLMFIAAIFVYGNLISPAYSEIANLRSELSTRSKAAEEQRVAIAQVQNLLKEYQNISSIETTIGAMLPLSPDPGASLNQIAGLAGASNLRLESLSVSRMANRPSQKQGLVKGVGVLRLSFQLSGSYSNFKAFLKAMETNVYLMDLVSLDMESQGLRAGNNVSFSMDADAYYQAQ